jgi:hypothetical protein
MEPSEMAHVGGEMKSTNTKQQKDKAWATKAQQNLPVNMAINSRLIVCKV